ncbi:MAG: SH3 domain-containing protein [Saprospiraceae bacterium]
MAKLQIISLLCLFCCCWACKNTNSTENQENLAENPTDSIAPVKPTSTSTQYLYAWVDKLRLRAEPDTKAKIVAEVKEGAQLTYLNEKTAFTQKITLRKVRHDEPWLKVATESGEEGWVYGGGVRVYQAKIDQAPSPYDDCYQLSDSYKMSQCVEQLNKKQLQKAADFIQVTATGYRIKLLDGTQKVLTERVDSLARENFLDYDYRYYIPKMGYYVFAFYAFESFGFTLVNDKSGKTLNLPGYPKPAPDFKHLVCYSPLPEMGFYSLAIWGFTDNGMTELFKKEMQDYLPYAPKWLDERTVQLSFKPTQPDQKLKVVELRADETGAWNMVAE